MAESIIKTQVLDDVSPEVRKLMDSLSPEGRRKLLRRIAHLLVEDAKRNFDDPANRPEPWADKKVYKRGRGLFSVPSNLKDTGSLLKSIKLKYIDSDSAEISASPDYTDSKGVRHAGAIQPIQPFPHSPVSNIPITLFYLCLRYNGNRHSQYNGTSALRRSRLRPYFAALPEYRRVQFVDCVGKGLAEYYPERNNAK